MTKHRVLLIVIDALASRVFFPALDAGKLPNFKRLADMAAVRTECCAVFPSITHAALSSMATGRYPLVHQIPGSHWFDRAADNLIHYAGDFRVAFNEGLLDSALDLIVRLNREQLQGETLFETVEAAGLKACCINHIIHRGDVRHMIDKPLLLDIMPRIGDIDYILGPTQLYMGSLAYTYVNGNETFPPADAGLSRRYGLDDEYTAETLLYLAELDALPELTVAYFMDNDFESHKEGPRSALPILAQVDACLGELFDAYDGLDNFVEQFCLIVTGDHAQADITSDEDSAAIDIDPFVTEFATATLGQPWNEAEEVVICPNMSTLQIYFRTADPQVLAQQIEAIGQRLLGDARVDQLIWREADVTSAGVGYQVATSDRGSLHFWPAIEQDEADAEYALDGWGCRWGWRGDLRTVDGQIDDEGVLRFDDYPNAFERIAGVLDSPTSGQLWATAHPGSEFRYQGSMVHTGGGAHGSLHASESLVPLLAAGLPSTVELPNMVRTVDVAPICLSVLGLSAAVQAGASHIC